MELSDLIGAVEAAKTKNELAILVSAELSLDLNKNKTLKVLRAEVLNGLGITQGNDAGEAEVVTPDDVPVSPTDNAQEAPVAMIVNQPLVVPAAETKDDTKQAKPTPENRMIRNTVTGVTFIWTAALSKLAVMEEV